MHQLGHPEGSLGAIDRYLGLLASTMGKLDDAARHLDVAIEINEAEVSLRLEFPENAYVPHDGWEQLQILPRLSSPDEQANAAGPATADGVRRSALGVARRLKLT